MLTLSSELYFFLILSFCSRTLSALPTFFSRFSADVSRFAFMALPDSYSQEGWFLSSRGPQSLNSDPLRSGHQQPSSLAPLLGPPIRKMVPWPAINQLFPWLPPTHNGCSAFTFYSLSYFFTAYYTYVYCFSIKLY